MWLQTPSLATSRQDSQVSTLASGHPDSIKAEVNR